VDLGLQVEPKMVTDTREQYEKDIVRMAECRLAMPREAAKIAGISVLGGAPASVLAEFFGTDRMSFTMTSGARSRESRARSPAFPRPRRRMPIRGCRRASTSGPACEDGVALGQKIGQRVARMYLLQSGSDVDIIFQVNGPVAQDLSRTPHVRIVSRARGNGVFWLDLPDQWDPKSPWHDRRVRQAASLALDRQAVNQAESLGTSRLTGSIVPRSFEFALPLDAPPHDPGKARQLLAEAGYPGGFDAGEFYPYPPLYAMGEALAGYLGAVGIRTRIRTLERAAFLTAWREKRLKGVLMGLNGSGGNAATRLEAYVTTSGIFAYGVVPEVEDLFQRQAREIDRAKRESLLHQIQRILHERVMHVPIYELSPMAGISARVEQAGVGLIPGYPYSAPYEDLQLKKP
jgi:peptide/nickel transport system substrate-binding protein